ncbi:hypothetical protein [Vreelandella alkaliphila]|uniref:hypothetical protein n=1 Tax=Vreelandella alkaliphila TaxID=272774 RepID=UPI003FD7A078
MSDGQIITLATSLIGWGIVFSLHVHYLRRDEASRKKDALKKDLELLADWFLNKSDFFDFSEEMRETFVATKATSIEDGVVDLFTQYFRVRDFYEVKSKIAEVRGLDVAGVDEADFDDFQIDAFHKVMNISDMIEKDYVEYCGNILGLNRVWGFFSGKKDGFLNLLHIGAVISVFLCVFIVLKLTLFN